MTKGKYAARSELRRESAAAQHVSRLIDELTDAKLRARMHEAAARELPVVKAELARVKALAEEGSSDTLERERDRHAKDLDKIDGHVSALSDLLIEIVERDDFPGLSITQWGKMRDLVGPLDECLVNFGSGSREARRRGRTGGAKLAAFMQRIQTSRGVGRDPAVTMDGRPARLPSKGDSLNGRLA